MKKAAKPVIITAALALILGGALALLLILPESGGSSDSGAQSSSSQDITLDFIDDDTQYPITAGEVDDLLSITVENPLGGFVISRQEVLGGASSSDSETDSQDGSQSDSETTYRHMVSGLGEVPQSDKYVSYFVENMAILLADQVVEQDPEDISKYGLDNPAATVALDFEEGEDITLVFGIRKPFDDNYIYCMANGVVFLVDYYTVQDAFYDARIYAELVLTDEWQQGGITSITIDRPDFEQPVELRYLSEYDNIPEGLVIEGGAKYALKSPALEVDPDRGGALYERLSELEMSACEYVEQTAEIFSECGFDTPAAVVTFTADGSEYTLTLGGNTPDGGYYAIFSGAAGVYSISAKSAVWATFSVEDIVTRTPISPYIYGCESVEVITENGCYLFKNEGGYFSFLGNALDENVFKPFFEELADVPCDEFSMEPAAGEAELVVRFTYLEKYAAVYGRQYDEYSYSGSDGRKYALSLNGSAIFKVNAVYVERVIEDLNDIAYG